MTQPLTGISSMATRALLAELTTGFEADTGQKVAIASVGGVDAAKRVAAGETFDLVLLASDALDKLAAAGQGVWDCFFVSQPSTALMPWRCLTAAVAGLFR